MDLFSEALDLVDDEGSGHDAALLLVAKARGSVERLLDVECRARQLERALPHDRRARRVHELASEAARLAVKRPSDARPPSALSERLRDSTGTPTPAVIDVEQLAADLERLRRPLATTAD